MKSFHILEDLFPISWTNEKIRNYEMNPYIFIDDKEYS